MMKDKLNLNMGLVSENVAIVPNEDISKWEARGFSSIENYIIFNYEPNEEETIMLGIPLTIDEFGAQKLIHSKITNLDMTGGDYGMGSLGFFELELETQKDGMRKLSFCIYASESRSMFDGKIIGCHSSFYDKYKPWVMIDTENTFEKFAKNIKGSVINNICVSKNECDIKITDVQNNMHTFWFALKSDKFPPLFDDYNSDDTDDDSGTEPDIMEKALIITYSGSFISV